MYTYINFSAKYESQNMRPTKCLMADDKEVMVNTLWSSRQPKKKKGEILQFATVWMKAWGHFVK